MSAEGHSDKNKQMLGVVHKDAMLYRKVKRTVGNTTVLGIIDRVHEQYSNQTLYDETQEEKVYRVVYADNTEEELPLQDLKSRIVLNDEDFVKDPRIVTLQQIPEVLEVACSIYTLCLDSPFVMANDFTLEEFEIALMFPQSSDLLARMQTRLLVTKKKEIAYLEQQERARNGIGFLQPYSWWSVELCNLVKSWYDDLEKSKYMVHRYCELNHMKTDKRVFYDGEPLVSDMRVYNLSYDQFLRKKDQISLLSQVIEPLGSTSPLKNADDYLELTVEVRLLLLKALFDYRMYDPKNTHMFDVMRTYKADILRQNMLGIDSKGLRYYYFHQFPNDRRIYREIPSGFSKHYSVNKDGQFVLKGKQSKPIVEEEDSSEDEMEEMVEQPAVEAEVPEELVPDGTRRSRRSKLNALKVEKEKQAKREAELSKARFEAKRRKKRKQRALKLKQLQEQMKVGRYDGIEPFPEKWELLCYGLSSVQQLLGDLSSEKSQLNKQLLTVLSRVEKSIAEAEEEHKRDQAKISKMLERQAAPRKRSRRLVSSRMKKLEQDKVAFAEKKATHQRKLDEAILKRQAMLKGESERKTAEKMREQQQMEDKKKRREDMINKRKMRAMMRSGILPKKAKTEDVVETAIAAEEQPQIESQHEVAATNGIESLENKVETAEAQQDETIKTNESLCQQTPNENSDRSSNLNSTDVQGTANGKVTDSQTKQPSVTNET